MFSLICHCCLLGSVCAFTFYCLHRVMLPLSTLPFVIPQVPHTIQYPPWQSCFLWTPSHWAENVCRSSSWVWILSRWSHKHCWLPLDYGLPIRISDRSRPNVQSRSLWCRHLEAGRWEACLADSSRSPGRLPVAGWNIKDRYARSLVAG